MDDKTKDSIAPFPKYDHQKGSTRDERKGEAGGRKIGMRLLIATSGGSDETAAGQGFHWSTMGFVIRVRVGWDKK